MLESLTLFNFRIFKQWSLTFHPRCTLIYGLNGSGKTTILEALYTVFLGRSFRTFKLMNLVSHGEKVFQVGIRLKVAEEEYRIGIKRELDGLGQTKINGKIVNAQAEVTKLLPVQLFNHQSFILLTDPPKIRRQFIDWGVFHLEPNFLIDWRRYERVLKQRNQQIRENFSTIWDNELAKLGEKLHQMRKDYLSLFLPFAQKILKNLLPSNLAVKIEYYPGWNTQYSFQENLEQQRVNDLRLGYTVLGAHRADLQIMVEENMAKDLLSRGQQKILVYGLQLAQGLFLQESNPSNSCLYLIDDPLAELDLANYSKFIEQLLSYPNNQLIITGLNQGNLEKLLHPCQQDYLEYDLDQEDCQRGELKL